MIPFLKCCKLENKIHFIICPSLFADYISLCYVKKGIFATKVKLTSFEDLLMKCLLHHKNKVWYKSCIFNAYPAVLKRVSATIFKQNKVGLSWAKLSSSCVKLIRSFDMLSCLNRFDWSLHIILESIFAVDNHVGLC